MQTTILSRLVVAALAVVTASIVAPAQAMNSCERLFQPNSLSAESGARFPDEKIGTPIRYSAFNTDFADQLYQTVYQVRAHRPAQGKGKIIVVEQKVYLDADGKIRSVSNRFE